jgi:FixJ family two-component response regulator
MDSLDQGEYRRAMGRELHAITSPPLVSVVDDDESVRESLPDLVRELGYSAQAFSSAEAFLASDYVDQTRCLILDVSMPRGMSGPDLQRELSRRGRDIAIIFITAQRDETIRQRVLEQGAIECLVKPFSDTALIKAIHSALHQR